MDLTVYLPARAWSGGTRQASRSSRRRVPPDLAPRLLSADAGDREAVAPVIGASRLGDARFERQLLLEVRRLAMGEGDVLALEQLDEDLDEAGIQLLAGDAAELDDRVVAGHRGAVGVARGHHVVGVGDGDDPGQFRNVVPDQAAGIAFAVDPLVVGEDDLGHRAVAAPRGT